MSGRRRSPLIGSGFLIELAQRLRDLRDARGLTLRQLAAKSGYSSGALSQAEAGRTVPSWELVTAFVQACGEDPLRWRHAWELARTPSPPPARIEPPLPSLEVDAADRVRPARRPWRRPVLGGAAAALLALCAVVAWLAVDQPRTHGPLIAAPSVRLVVTAAYDNTDPYEDGCKADEKQLDWQPVYRRSGAMFGSIILMYSPACQAAWGYLNGPNSSAWTIHIVTRRIPGPGIVRWQFSGNIDSGSWGNVLSTRRGCVYAEAYVVDRSGEGPHARTACIQPTG